MMKRPVIATRGSIYVACAWQLPESCVTCDLSTDYYTGLYDLRTRPHEYQWPERDYLNFI